MYPTAIFPSPVTAPVIAPLPTATFLLPVVRPVSASYPSPVLSSPSVIASNAIDPTPRLYSAEFNVPPELLIPINMDPVKLVPATFESESPSRLEAVNVFRSEAGIDFIVPPSLIIIPSVSTTVIELPTAVPPSRRFNSSGVEET